MKEFRTEWLTEDKEFENAHLIKGVPGIGNISHVSTDYLIEELNAELIAKVYSPYLPSVALLDEDAVVDEPHYSLYYKELKDKSLLLLTNPYPPKKDYYNYLCCDYLSDLIKDLNVEEVITIAGIALKKMPEEIELHCAVTTEEVKEGLEDTILKFTGKKKVGLIIGNAGLLLTRCASKGIPGFSILVTTWAHPKYVGVKESKKTIKFLKNYLGFDVDFSDLNKDIKKLNKKMKEARKAREQWNDSDNAKHYIG